MGVNMLVESLSKILFLTTLLFIPIGLFWLFNRVAGASKIKKYRSFSRVMLILGSIVLLATASFYVEKKTNLSSGSTEADGFTIEEYKVKLNVDENNVVKVEENITVNFYEEGHHGIYRFIPRWLEYTGKDGNTLSRESEVSKLKALGDEYTVDEIKGKDRVKIGSPNYTLSRGLKEYTITYQYDMGKDPYEEFDEFIFHFFGDYWGTKINNASIEVTMPKEIDENSIKFFADKYRKNDISSYVDYHVVGNTLYAKVSNNYSLIKSLTLDIELPEGYFINGNNNYGLTSLIMCSLIILFLIIVLIKWFKYGKDYKFSSNFEYQPPEGLDAASIGYINKKDSGRKLTISLILQLATEGYIKIDNSDDGKIIITKNDLNNTDFKFKKEMTYNERIVYDQLFLNGNINVLSDDKEFYQVFNRINENLQNELDDKINDTISYKNMAFTSILFFIGAGYFLFAFSIIKDLNPKYSSLYLLSLISLIMIFILTIVMKRKNNYGEELCARIKGFKNYIATARKDEIDMLTNTNPDYFYDILPYAYVFGMSKAWTDKFKNIPLPSHMGNFCYYNNKYFDRLSDEIYYPSSSSSSCGGGCSSCGGGCSSCGGGGSW